MKNIKKLLFLTVLLLIAVLFTKCDLLVYLVGIFGIDKDYRIKDKSFLDTQITKLQPKIYHPMKFGIDTQIFIGMGELAGDEKSLSSYAFSEKLLKVFIELDIDIIRVGVLDDAWQLKNGQEIALSDQLIKKIKESGKKILLADTQHSPYILKHKVIWEEFQKIHLRRIEFFVKRYDPDYYCVVTEPSLYHLFGVKGKMDTEKWLSQTQDAVDLVKRINDKIQTAVSVGPGDERDRVYLQKVFQIKNLDIVGIEAYYPKDIIEIEKILKTPLDKQGKKIWITESWSGMPFPYTTVSGKEKEDAKWVKMITYFAQTHGFECLMVWPFQYFVTYERFEKSERKVDFSKRTVSFLSFKEMINETRLRSSANE